MKKDTKREGEKSAAAKGERIAKVMARAGLCSRRDAERWIEMGRVQVNGKILRTPACVVSDADTIVVDGKALPRSQNTALYLYHKPAGLVTTAKDEKGRKTVFDTLPDNLPRLVSVGRLDLNTEGLLLLTNDGELSRFLELPSNKWVRVYRVRALGKTTQDKLDSLKKGVTIDEVRYGEIQATLEKPDGANIWLRVSITEGKNREVRKIMEYLGLQVNRLIRTSYGPFQLGNMPKGAVREVPEGVLREHCSTFFKGKA